MGTILNFPAIASIGAGDINNTMLAYGIDPSKIDSVPTMQQFAEQAIEVVRLDASASLTPNTYTKVLPDFFSDSTGLQNSVDATGGAGNTDATFDNAAKSYYADFLNSPVIDAHGLVLVSSASYAQKWGLKITVTANTVLTKVVKHSSCDATKCYIYDSGNPVSGNLLAQADFAGDDATFALAISSSTTYYVVVDKAGAAFTVRYVGGAGIFPVAGTKLNWVAGWYAETNTDSVDFGSCVVSVTTTEPTSSSRTVKSAALSGLNGTYTKIALFCHGKSLPTGTNVKWDLDANGDGTYNLTDQTVDTVITSAQTLAGAKIRVQLNRGTGAGADQPLFKGWALAVWT